MKNLAKLAVLLFISIAFATAPVWGAQAAIYGSNTGYAGTGKHPKTGVSGLIIDGKTRGVSFVCYDYVLITSDKIKGQVSGIAERISGNKVEKIATFGTKKVEPFDFNQIPPGDDRCTDVPDERPDFNLGFVSDCVEVNSAFDPGDIVRWTFKFKKGSKLKGQDASIQVSGSVLPFASFAPSRAQAEQLLRRVEGPRRELLPSRSER